MILLSISCCFGQTSIAVNASLNEAENSFSIEQEIIYENTGNVPLDEIYLNDWANSFSDKSTPLARRFAEDYIRRFHFAKEEERGGTNIDFIISGNSKDSLDWKRPEGAPDLIKINLKTPLLPGKKYYLQLNYKVKIPSDKFTRYGIDDAGNYKLKHWYITPAVYNKEWQVYSHKNLDNEYTPPANIDITLNIPPQYYVASALNSLGITTKNGNKMVRLAGKNRVESKIYITKSYLFESIYANSLQVLTNIEDDGLRPELKGLMLDRILKFLEGRLGEYPHNTVFITQDDYLNNPVYGLNQLPSFIRPFPDGFQYDIKQLKTLLDYYLKTTVFINPLKEKWVHDGIMVSLMMDYVDQYYPHMNLLGNLSDIIGIRWFHAADLEFNDQYQFLSMNTTRLNLDQPLSTAQDSLVKFNRTIANAYKAGVGLKYVEYFLGDDAVKNSISEFYEKHKLQLASESDFEEILKKNAQKDLDWFFKDYVKTNKKIDFTIQTVKKEKDSLRVKIRNKQKNSMPVSLYGLSNGEVIYKTWVEDITNTREVSIPKENIDRVALNYEQKIPEFNERDNYKRVTTLFNKPLQFRLLQDVEDPRYTQLFFMPEFDYNLYDGISIGPKLYNTTVLKKNFEFKIAPKYGFNSETLVGSAGFSHNLQFKNQKLHSVQYGISGTRFSYAYNLFYEKFTPFLRFSYRNPYLRDNKRQSLLIRNVNVNRDIDINNPVDKPNYNVFNVNYRYSDANMVDYFSGSLDYQLSDKFSKVSLSLEYRKLFQNNRQINFRFFAGSFLYNDDRNSDYFSFALDRPTDYLFDYNYYGRSQGSGLFSQQIIMAEGGFKSQLQPEFANQWLTSLNGSTNLWKWIFIYGDVGLVKNREQDPALLYDSGLRVSLVADYFEVFFPVYSNLGWEVSQPDYDQKIRFIVALDIKTLIKLFTRQWY